MKENKFYQMNAIKLAYVGDAIFSLMIRKHFVENTEMKNRDLNKTVNSIVCAKAQAQFLENVIEDLTDIEKDIILRARNAHVNNKAKNSSFEEYNKATQFEALLGYLYLTNEKDKLEKIVQNCIEHANK
ncbi:MAG: Mini-ribonuclease 3 [Clostridia bacterium]|nr:Mini-ribonuclease 3 [Clostridia bacterium]